MNASRHNYAAQRSCLPGRRAGGIVLLEVILALTLFFASAATILGALNMSIRAVRHSAVKAQAADLAVTLFSEIGMEILAVADVGPEAFDDEDLADWTWQVAVEAVANTSVEISMNRVEVIVAHTPSGYSYHLVQLLAVQDEDAVQGPDGFAMSGGRP